MRRLELAPLEERRLLAAPFSVGGDPIVNPADFRVTTFASGLNYPHGLQTLSDGSLLVAVNNPNNGGANIFDTTGELLRFTDTNQDGIDAPSPTIRVPQAQGKAPGLGGLPRRTWARFVAAS